MKRMLFALIPVLLGVTVAAQPRQQLTAADYDRAARFMGFNTTPLVYRSGIRPNWLPDDRFWYRVTTAEGSEFVLVDPVKRTKAPAFDHAKLAALLSAAANARYEANRLPFTQIELSSDARTVSFDIARRHWTCDDQKCVSSERPAEATAGGRGGGRGGAAARTDVPSPDGKRTAFIRDWNLWVRDIATGKETQLTKDGVKDYGYATDNAGWTRSDRAIVLWSPDSKKIATFQQDQRKVAEMYLVDTRAGHPTLQAWKYPLPGDDIVSMIERVVIEVDNARLTRLRMPPDQHRSTLCDDITCRGGDWSDVEWSPDSTKLAFVSTSRDHKEEDLRVADVATGEIRNVLSEKVETFYESGNGRVNWRMLHPTNELIWFSERDNWGQLYLYDTQTKNLKNQITTGEGNVTQLLRVDEKNRALYFLGVGRERLRDPYFTHFYRIGFDGKNPTLLTPEDANHDVMLAPSGRFFVDSYSKPDIPPVAVLRDTDGHLVLELERADISKLLATGWQPPTSFTVKARDGQTDLYGLMYKPTHLDVTRKYPIVNRIYPGPQTGSVGSRNFSAARGDDHALAELGFVVVEIDGMGTPWRTKKFHEAYYGNMGDNTLPDQVAGMKQLAQRYPWIDLDRVGIWGHSGGGFATAAAMFRYPDFFKVGIAESGNHDNRVYEDDWAEKWQGLLQTNADGTTNYDNQANQLVAKNLKGKLLLAHGTMDANVPPNSTLLVVEALIKANKDFDLLMLPNQGHGFGEMSNYMTRRRWDYFVRHLLGIEPPREYELKPPTENRQTTSQQ